MNSDLDLLSSPTPSQSASQTKTTDLSEILQDSAPSSVEVQCEVPSALEQLNCKGKYYVIWDAKQTEIFDSWWNQLSAAKKCRQPHTKVAHPCWANAHRTSKSWEAFHQAAEKRTGDPGLICKKCHFVLAHPTYSRNGPSGMTKHLKSRDCELNASAQGTKDIATILVS